MRARKFAECKVKGSLAVSRARDSRGFLIFLLMLAGVLSFIFSAGGAL